MFDFEKRIVNYLIDLPKAAKTRYALMDYHDASKILINFDDFQDKEKLKNRINSINWQGDGNDFENLLSKAKEIFEMSEKARKVFVIFVNDRLNVNLAVIRDSVRKLNALGIKVVVVRIGERVDDQEVSALTTSAVVSGRTTDDVSRVGELAGSATLKGETTFL